MIIIMIISAFMNTSVCLYVCMSVTGRLLSKLTFCRIGYPTFFMVPDFQALTLSGVLLSFHRICSAILKKQSNYCKVQPLMNSVNQEPVYQYSEIIC